MKTGIVVNNYDPKFQNRIQIRVIGVHTEKVGGKYVIIDDDLPWALPAPQSTAFGASSVPDVGSTVYVDVIDRFRYIYYGQVDVKGDIKDIMHTNADSSDKVKVIAYSDDVFDGEKSELRIMYVPDDGLVIKCNGHIITMTKYNGLDIKAKSGAEIKIDADNTININSPNTINLNCDKVNLSEGASERAILSSKLIEKFNNHTHLCPYGVSAPTMMKLEETDLSDKVKIG